MNEEGKRKKKTPNMSYQSFARILQNAILHYISLSLLPIFCWWQLDSAYAYQMDGCMYSHMMEKGFSIKTAAQGSLLPPKQTLHAPAHSAGALGKARFGTQANPAVQPGHAESNSHCWSITWSRQLLRNGWHQTGVLLCAHVCVISGLWETVGFLPPSCRIHSMTPAHAILRKFLWFTLKFFCAEFYPFEHLKIIPFLS